MTVIRELVAKEPQSSFEKLAAVNVNSHIEKKNGLSYLSWAWALDQLMRQDPQAEWTYPEPKMFGETMMVYCSVTAFGKTKTAHLPVMDYRNKPIPNPDAFAVNTAMQRCLVKAIALHGLGLYVYAGEDCPPDEAEIKEKKTAEPDKDGEKLLKGASSIEELQDIWRSLSVEQRGTLGAVKDAKKSELEGFVQA